MKMRVTKADKAAKKNNTRALTERLQEYCEERGFMMPEEFLICVMNGIDPREGVTEEIESKDSISAAKALMPYLYAKKQDVKVQGTVGIFPVPSIEADPEKLKEAIEKVSEIL